MSCTSVLFGHKQCADRHVFFQFISCVVFRQENSHIAYNDSFQDMELILEPDYGLTGFRSVLKRTIN